MTLTPHQIANDPRLFAATFLKILNKQKELRPLTLNAAQADFHAHRTGRDLILKARQLGFSTYVQGEMFRRTVTSTRSTITLAHDDTTTGLLRRMADRYYENCRFNDIQPQRKYANAGLTTYPELNSEAIIAKAGSQDVGRGATLTDFHGSEVAFWPDAEKIIGGAMQGGSPDVVLESTPNGAQGTFYEYCMDGRGIWTLHFYPWWWDASYAIESETPIQYTDEEAALVAKHNLTMAQIRWRREKQKELGRLFIQEYPEDPISCFLTSGNSYFGDMTGVFTAPANAEYQQGHRYNAGLDFGQANDYTAMSVKDITANVEVELMRVRGLEWAEIRKRVKGVYNKWHLASLLAERNSIGEVNIEQMQKDGMSIQPFETTNQSKAEIMSDLNESIHAGGYKLLDDPAGRNEMNTFIATQTSTGLWRLAAEGEGHDDTVIARALANRPALWAIMV
jgi:hypothetical protein